MEVGADATEASAASPGRELLTEVDPGNASRKSEPSNLAILLRSGSVGANDLASGGDGSAGGSDGESKPFSSEVECADVAGFRAGSMGAARARREATMEDEDRNGSKSGQDRIKGTGDTKRVAEDGADAGGAWTRVADRYEEEICDGIVGRSRNKTFGVN